MLSWLSLVPASRNEDGLPKDKVQVVEHKKNSRDVQVELKREVILSILF